MDTTKTKMVVRKPTICTYCKSDVTKLQEGASCPHCGCAIVVQRFDPRRVHTVDPRKAQPQ